MFFLQNILRYISSSSYLESGLTTGNRYYEGSVVIVTFIMKQQEPFWNRRICCLDLLDKKPRLSRFTLNIIYTLSNEKQEHTTSTQHTRRRWGNPRPGGSSTFSLYTLSDVCIIIIMHGFCSRSNLSHNKRYTNSPQEMLGIKLCIPFDMLFSYFRW